jgi:hypothetical protein
LRSSAQNAAFTTQQFPLLGNNHVTADLNGDGRLNLAGTGSNAVSVVFNVGTAAFGPKTISRLLAVEIKVLMSVAATRIAPRTVAVSTP